MIFRIKNAIPRMPEFAFSQPIDWTVNQGEQWVIIAANGAGKSLLIDVLLGKRALKKGTIEIEDNKKINNLVKLVVFKNIYSMIDTQNSFYQQRWNIGCEDESPIVETLLDRVNNPWIDELISILGIEDLLNKQIKLLSSGELRKILIVKALEQKPKILILDNPYIGLDTQSRKLLNNLFKDLVLFQKIQLVLVLSNPADIPDTITNILPIKDKTLLEPVSADKFKEDNTLKNYLFEKKQSKPTIKKLIKSLKDNRLQDFLPFENALLFKNISVKYGNRDILKDLNWQVKSGSKWALLGENGSGKSTLLSLVSGDNPQAYANDITLFDKKRGSGESIWDIKKRIGYISPEMHLYYLKNIPCIDVVASGFFDTIGLYKKCNDQQQKIATKWMQLFGIENIKDQSFIQISSGEQRLVLLARVFVKNPDLLILDEPLHGLDLENKALVKNIIEEYCDATKTLIYVTHYDNEIPQIVNNRLLLKKIAL